MSQAAHQELLTERLNAVSAKYRVAAGLSDKPVVRDLLAASPGRGPQTDIGHVDVPWPVSLTPIVLPARLISEVRNIGALVPGALRCSWDMLGACEDVRSFIFRSPKAEGEHFDPRQSYPLGDAPLFRLDLLLEQNGTEIVPWLVDINLMAGMAGVTAEIQHAYAAYSDLLWGPNALLGSFDLDAWAQGIADGLPDPAPGTGVIDYVVRSGHALVPDAQTVVSALQRNGTRARLTPLDELGFAEGRLTDASGDRVRRVFRQVRATTKHAATAAVGLREAQAFEHLTDAWRSGAVRMAPGFHMYLESHAWMHYWRDEEFAHNFRALHGEADRSYLMSRIPPTLRVVDEERVAPTRFSVRERRPGDLDGAVLKRADSTGGAGLKMTSRPASAGERAELTASLTASHREGLLLQERVRQSRFTFPVPDADGEPSPVSGTLKLAAYFRGGTYLGGHALLTPDDRRRLPPSSVLRLLPLFVPVYGSRG
ncbi:hypothetical protein [Streptomyces viridochromogenes]|uniref:hypothetical protein n=1 Tax=Streptomyces viridochromogenes TaxID=1938 RepID=UPI00131A9C3A|nr:hypothetical protein [Streptomyces viridochromogenes]